MRLPIVGRVTCGATRHRPCSARAPGAPIVLVGEQPGDQEDSPASPSSGRPASARRGARRRPARRARLYVTNAVKHFKLEPTRQAAHPQETARGGDSRVPAVAVARAGARSAASRGVPGNLSCARRARSVSDPQSRAWPAHSLGARTGRLRHHASLGDTSREGFSISS